MQEVKTKNQKHLTKRKILTTEEYLIFKDIITDSFIFENKIIDNLNFKKILDKFKNYSKKGLISIGILTSLLSLPGLSQAQKMELKKNSNIEFRDDKKKNYELNEKIAVWYYSSKEEADKAAQLQKDGKEEDAKKLSVGYLEIKNDQIVKQVGNTDTEYNFIVSDTYFIEGGNFLLKN